MGTVSYMAKGGKILEIKESPAGFFAELAGSGEKTKEDKLLGRLISELSNSGWVQVDDPENINVKTSSDEDATPCGIHLTDKIMSELNGESEQHEFIENVVRESFDVDKSTGSMNLNWSTLKGHAKDTPIKDRSVMLRSSIGGKTDELASNTTLSQLNKKYKTLLNDIRQIVVDWYGGEEKALKTYQSKFNVYDINYDAPESAGPKNRFAGRFVRDALRKDNPVSWTYKLKSKSAGMKDANGNLIGNPIDGFPMSIDKPGAFDFLRVFSYNTSIFKFGNKKIGTDTLIFSMASALLCPSRKYCPLGGPRGACYAASLENTYKAYFGRFERNRMLVLAATQMHRNGDDTLFNKLHDIFIVGIELANANLAILHRRNPFQFPEKVRFVRLNETGDFLNEESVKFFDNLAGELQSNYGISLYCYTANKSLAKAISQTKNMIINASREDTPSPTSFRKFQAITEQEYLDLPDTDRIHKNGVTIPVLKHFFDPTDKDKGFYYYKCPCGIPKNLKWTDEEGNIHDFKGVSHCNECGVCYTASPGVSDLSHDEIKNYHVLIMAHGANSQWHGENIGLARRKVRMFLGLTPDVVDYIDSKCSVDGTLPVSDWIEQAAEKYSKAFIIGSYSDIDSIPKDEQGKPIRIVRGVNKKTGLPTDKAKRLSVGSVRTDISVQKDVDAMHDEIERDFITRYGDKMPKGMKAGRNPDYKVPTIRSDLARTTTARFEKMNNDEKDAEKERIRTALDSAIDGGDEYSDIFDKISKTSVYKDFISRRI